jgi:hypothetical protein
MCTQCWEGDGVVKAGRVLLGATKPSESLPGSIRGDLCIDVGRNICHGSDAVESAEKEIALWFKPEVSVLLIDDVRPHECSLWCVSTLVSMVCGRNLDFLAMIVSIARYYIIRLMFKVTCPCMHAMTTQKLCLKYFRTFLHVIFICLSCMSLWAVFVFFLSTALN